MKYKTTIKDLELQIDYLIGYNAGGNHWKQEYYIRKLLLDNCMADPSTPPETLEKLNNIQEQIYLLRNKEKKEQPYLDSRELIRAAMSELGKLSARKNKRDYSAMGKASSRKTTRDYSAMGKASALKRWGKVK